MQALLAFADEFGLPRRIQAVGHHAVLASQLLQGAVRERACSTSKELRQHRDMAKWIIFDRGADLCTPFMSQLTLEGRLDELQNIASGTGWLPGERGAGVCCMRCPENRYRSPAK